MKEKAPNEDSYSRALQHLKHQEYGRAMELFHDSKRHFEGAKALLEEDFDNITRASELLERGGFRSEASKIKHLWIESHIKRNPNITSEHLIEQLDAYIKNQRAQKPNIKDADFTDIP